MNMIVDRRGATFISMRLLMSIVVIVVISSLFYVGLKNIMPSIAEAKVERQVNALDNLFQEMITGDARDVALYEDYKTQSGERRTFSFDLPSQLNYLGIGTDPDPDNDGQLERNLMEDGTVIVYKVEGRSKKIHWLDEDIRIRLGEYKDGNWLIKKPEEGLILKAEGKFEITFELVKYHNKKYILIHSNNSNFIPYFDNNPPFVSIISPVEGTYSYGDILIQWVVFDDIGIKYIKVEYKSSTSDWIVIEEKSAMEWEKWECILEKEKIEQYGEYWIRVTAADEGNNIEYDVVKIHIS